MRLSRPPDFRGQKYLSEKKQQMIQFTEKHDNNQEIIKTGKRERRRMQSRPNECHILRETRLLLLQNDTQF